MNTKVPPRRKTVSRVSVRIPAALHRRLRRQAVIRRRSMTFLIDLAIARALNDWKDNPITVEV